MLPIFKAFAFQEFALKGGSSQPCIMSVKDENGNLLKDDYVIKIYRDTNLNNTSKEVYGSVLAKHFGLKTPEPILIEMDNTMLNILKQHEKYKNWNVTEGVFFASKYLTGVQSFTDTLPFKYLDEWEMGNVFAFDVFIMNKDRQLKKPNVIIKNQDIYVIDHELSLGVSKTFQGYLVQNYWDYTIKENRGGHLFRQYLWKIGKKNRITFDEFTENLRTLNPEILYNYAEQLSEYQYEPLDIKDIVTYIAEIQKNESKFLALLDKLLFNK